MNQQISKANDLCGLANFFENCRKMLSQLCQDLANENEAALSSEPFGLILFIGRGIDPFGNSQQILCSIE